MKRLNLLAIAVLLAASAVGCNMRRSFCFRGDPCNECSGTTMTYSPTYSGEISGTPMYEGPVQAAPMTTLPGPAATTVPTLPTPPPPTG
jgi:hypothetical protein